MILRVIRGLSAILPVAAVTAALCAAPPADAAFGPIQLVSKSSREQAGKAGEPTVSADGRYVAFVAELGGKEGIFRRQLETGELTKIAVGAPSFGAPNASAPSISADGRYVSFTTDQKLTEEDEDGVSDVYVADMDSSPPTYRLVSAATGGETPLPGGSLAADRDAISGDGNRVAFVNEGNVYVREISTERTILISARRDPLTGTMEEEMPVEGGGAYEPAGAAISADGSTVAWVGEHLPQQVPLLGDEQAAIETIENRTGGGPTEAQFHKYHEPLWRRVPGDGGEDPLTRRIVGGGDPLAPGCPPTGTLEEAACQGPYPASASNHDESQIWERNGSGWGVKLPALDADGDEVVLAGDPDADYDLFLVDMEEGLDRREAVRQLTRWTNPTSTSISSGGKFAWEVISGGSGGEYFPLAGEISDCAISPDGTRLAFTTTRQIFSTSPLTLVTEAPSAVGLLAELYEVNLEGDTIERATPAPGGDISEGQTSGGANTPSFGAGDRLIAFASVADNLVPADANEASDVFTVESPPPAPIGQSTVSPRPPETVIQPGWRMSANAYSRPDGDVKLIARVPGAGTLRAAARAQVGARLKSRQVAVARRRSETAGSVNLELKLPGGRRSLARRPGLVTRIKLSFSGHGGGPLHLDLQGRFVIHHKQPAGHRTAAKG